MSVLINKNSRVIVQGFTGIEGTFHAEQMIQYGTNIVGGVTPGKGGTHHLGKPVFNTVENAVKYTKANVSIIFVPAPFAADAIMEAIESEIVLIVCITEGIPINDMLKVKQYIKNTKSKLIGPNCPGIITPEESKVGIMPGFVFRKGKIGVISKSGTLTYEAADQVVKSGHGISTAIGIGGDPIIGVSIQDVLKLFMNDINTDCIVIIGEIGGSLEIEAAKWYQLNKNVNLKFKPIVSFIAGQTAPKNRKMGHAGAIVGKDDDSAQKKMDFMKNCGIYVVKSPADIGYMVNKVVSKNINLK